MSNNKNKYVPLAGGLTCKRQSPYTGIEDYFETDTTTVLELTEVMPEGEEFDGVEVHQYWYTAYTDHEWLTFPDTVSPKALEEIKATNPDEFRIAIKPLKAIEPVKKLYWCETCGYDIIEGKCRCKQTPPTDAVENKEVMMIINRQKHPVDNGSNGDHVSHYFVKVANKYQGSPHVAVSHYENSNERLSILKIDDKTVATVIETRTEFNHVEFVFSELPTPTTVDESLDAKLILRNHFHGYSDEQFEEEVNRFPLNECLIAMSDHAQQSKDKYTQVKHDADIMFNSLFAIISDDTIDDLDKCMTVASKAINSIIDKTSNDTPKTITT